MKLLLLVLTTLTLAAQSSHQVYALSERDSVRIADRWQAVIEADAKWQTAKDAIKEAYGISMTSDLDFNDSFTAFVVYAPEDLPSTFRVHLQERRIQPRLFHSSSYASLQALPGSANRDATH